MSKSVDILWQRPNDTYGGELESYGVFYRIVNTPKYSNRSIKTTDVNLQPLKPYTSYEVYVVAYTKAANGKVLQGLGSRLEQFKTLVASKRIII